MYVEGGIGDLLPSIFLCLPVQSLFRFKCLNKDCNEAISDPTFVVLHHAKATPTTIPSKPLALLCFPKYSNPSNHVLYLPLYPQQPPYYFRLNLPNSIQPCISIEASCNGLFLYLPPSHFVQTPLFFTVFNPTTNKFQLIPTPQGYNYPIPETKQVDLGLAYDPLLFSCHHYKIVHIFVANRSFLLGNQVYGFQIFSSSLNSWKISRSRLRCQVGEICQVQAVYLDGFLHWIRKRGDIVAFNVNTEEGARIIPIPYKLGLKLMEYQDRMPWFGIARGLISVAYLSRSEFVVWVLHDYDKCKWGCVRTHIACLASRNDLYVIFYDGECVVFRGKSASVIYMHNLRSNQLKMLEVRQPEETCYDDDKKNENVYIPFIPSLALMNTTSATADDQSIKQVAATSSNSRGKQNKRKIDNNNR